MKLDDQPPAAPATVLSAGRCRVALISDHASPLAAPGGLDCGGQNVYVAHLARELALALAPGRFTVLQLGRMVPRKGVGTVIEAVALVRGAHGIAAELLVVGGDAQPGGRDGAELARLRALARTLGIASHVR
jgi:glycosyltransferase involved in cell wall biosynthesis